MSDEISIFMLGYIFGCLFTFTILYCFYITTLKHLVTVNINNTYKDKQQMEELQKEELNNDKSR